KAAAKKAAAKKAAAEQKEKEQLEADKLAEDELAREKEEQDTLVSAIIVAVVLAILVFIAMSKNMRKKIFGGKKKKMMDVMSDLEKAKADTKKTVRALPPMKNDGQVPISLTPELSIEREAPDDTAQAAPRKKISLAPGNATESLNLDKGQTAGGLTPPGGGLPPPGGGLTPPGGGLTPPGGLKEVGEEKSNQTSKEDKSNLILNPNLNGSGDKIRLKK
ncbi:MAG: hypothetical protein HRT88_12345, partial [Lentisphaeraceae bacterium]|nr:hypothetical protein [Lentisphaeraceae bacterium]